MRIISGEHKGRRLLSPSGRSTRPITDKVKLALFNILGGSVEGAVVADLFCGTGSLGLEALSRGARLCCFAEADAAAVELLARNIQNMRLSDRCRIWHGDVLARLEAWLGGLGEPLDLAFVDPPYRLAEEWSWDQACGQLFAPLGTRLSQAGQVVFRCRKNLTVPEALGPLRVWRRRDYGKMSLLFLAGQR
jgi:16S rRNA (guanine966-N2)-methyltransferase